MVGNPGRPPGDSLSRQVDRSHKWLWKTRSYPVQLFYFALVLVGLFGLLVIAAAFHEAW